MKQIKRSLAILLAVLLTLSCCPVSVLAAEDDPAPEGVVVEQTEASVETEETAAEPESDGAAEAEEISALDTGDYFEAVAQVTIGGETGAYDDIYTAIEALADAEEADAACLQLLADVEDMAIEVYSGVFTLDLNGHVLSGDEYVLKVMGTANITLTDSSAA